MSFLSFCLVICLSFQPQVYPQATWCGFRRGTMFLYPGIQWKQGTMSQKSLVTRSVSHRYRGCKLKHNVTARVWYFFPLQVLLRQEGRGHSQVMRTPNSAVVLTLPEGGTYIIEVLAVSEGGEGASSAQVRVLTSSGKSSLCGFSDLRMCMYVGRLDGLIPL